MPWESAARFSFLLSTPYSRGRLHKLRDLRVEDLPGPFLAGFTAAVLLGALDRFAATIFEEFRLRYIYRVQAGTLVVLISFVLFHDWSDLSWRIEVISSRKGRNDRH